MTKVAAANSKITRADKTHRKIMDRLEIFKDGAIHSLDMFALIHKQTLDSASEYVETISKSQEAERCKLYEIIETTDDEIKYKAAFARLTELDRMQEQNIQNYNELAQGEGDKANKNIAGTILCLAAACGFLSNKQVRQMSGKVLNTVGKNLLHIIK